MTPPDAADFLTPKQGFLIVGLGASAGGVQALKEFFEYVPADSHMAYVVILHLSPDHDSQLAQILQTVSAIPVTQVRQKVTIEPNNVYVVSPNQHLVLEDDFIVPTSNVREEERRAPVDIFFSKPGRCPRPPGRERGAVRHGRQRLDGTQAGEGNGWGDVRAKPPGSRIQRDAPQRHCHRAD